jgi:hypothetical protein
MDYILIFGGVLALYFLFQFFPENRNPKGRLAVNIIAIIGFATMFLFHIAKKNWVISNDFFISFLLLAGIVIYLANNSYKNYKLIKGKDV